MNENRENQFYEIIRKENIFQVLITYRYDKESTVIFTLECEDLIQCDRVLIAKQSNGLYSIYLPARKDKCIWAYSFICIVENVKEFQYYKSKEEWEGWLLLKVETSHSCGYWTIIKHGSFEWHLTPERAKTRYDSLFKIPYTGVSKASVMEELEYLFYNELVVKIDNEIYLVTYEYGSVYEEREEMELEKLGKVQVEPLPFKYHFKVISEEGESFFNIIKVENEDRENFGPFFKIEKVDFEDDISKVYLICYFGKDKNDKILGIYYKEISEDGNRSYESKIIFDSPVKEAKIVQIIKTDEWNIASWKLLYDDGQSKILLSSICIKESKYVILDPLDYI